MKYELALKEKNLQEKDVTKKIQLNIKKLKGLEKKSESLAGEEKEKLSQEIIVLDAETEKLVKKFDMAKHQNKLRVIAEMNKRKEEIKVQDEDEVHEQEEYSEGEVEGEYEYEEEVEEAPEQQVATAPKFRGVRRNLNRVNRNLEELKKNAEVSRGMKNLTQEQEEDEEWEEEEIEDFKKTKEVKPKKMSTALMLMGAGAFLLTWGAVNLWKERH